MIVDENWNLLKSGQEVTNLITKEWTTDIAGKTDSSGVFATQCFFGDYVIEVKTKDNIFSYNAVCRRNADRIVLFILP
jgi:hypothetical protein